MVVNTPRKRRKKHAFFNVFGSRQDTKNAYAAAIPIFMQNAFANEYLTIFGDGEQARDFIHVKDIFGALFHAVPARTYTAPITSAMAPA